MPVPYPEPSDETADPAVLLDRSLCYFRDAVLAKVAALDDDAARTTYVPSGWSPLELLWHLAHMERRWVEWGFHARPVDEPWGDHTPGEPGRWRVPGHVTVQDVAERLDVVARETSRLLAQTPLDAVAATGGRFDADPPTLAAIAFHVLREYARHAGHLDVAVELAGGPTGE